VGRRGIEPEQWRLALDEEGRPSKDVTNRIRGLEMGLAFGRRAQSSASPSARSSAGELVPMATIDAPARAMKPPTHCPRRSERE
jgi:hypothetical protein